MTFDLFLFDFGRNLKCSSTIEFCPSSLSILHKILTFRTEDAFNIFGELLCSSCSPGSMAITH